MTTTNKNSIGKKMKNFSFFIFTFSLIMTSSLWANFSRNNSGIVTDNSTGLVWQDDYSCLVSPHYTSLGENRAIA